MLICIMLRSQMEVNYVGRNIYIINGYEGEMNFQDFIPLCLDKMVAINRNPGSE